MKSFSSLLIFCLCVLISCKDAPRPSSSTLKDRTYDTLLKYTPLDYGQLYDTTDGFRLYIDHVNNKKTGVIAIGDSMLLLYQMFNDDWRLSDSIAFKTWAFDYAIKDLNGDGLNDFIVGGFPNVHGQSIPYVFMCNKDTVLHYRPDLTHYNIEYDSSAKLVKSYYIGGIYSKTYKEYYHWKNDSLELVRGVEREHADDMQFFTSFYELRNGEMIYYKKVLDNTENIYDTALWKVRF